MRTMIIGMGLMGSALADALLRENMTVSVWNRTPGRCRPAVDAGATHAASVADGAGECDVIITCLADHSAVIERVITPEVGRLLAGKTFVQLSQAMPEQSLEFAAWAADHGIGYLEGSILGYPKDVREGDCVIVYSGEPATFHACHDVLLAMGSKPRLVGDQPGIATAFDKAFFAFYYAHALGLLHGAAICRAAGIPLDAYLELMVDDWDWKLPDSVTADVLKGGDYAVREGTLETHAHACDQVVPYCSKIGVDTGLAKAIERIVKAGIDLGHGHNEIASLIEVLNPSGDHHYTDQ